MKQGIFYGVGIGPGDPELLTLKAQRILTACSVIAAPQTRGGDTLALDIARKVVDLEGKTIVPLSFPMERDLDRRRAAHQTAAALVATHLSEGRDVAMPNLGDVSIYATYSYLMEILRAAGYTCVMIPGVPSFCAVAARLGESLTSMDAPLHILPAGGMPLEEALALSGTKVLMKSGKSMPQVLDTLRTAGLLKKAALVQNCCLEEERVCTDLSEFSEETSYFSIIIVKE